MLLHIRKDTVVDASPQAVFDVVTDVTRHPELAGSGEVLSVRKLTDGPVAAGTRFKASEDVATGLGSERTQFEAESKVLVCDPPHAFSWKSTPPNGPKPRQLQWWFWLSPEGQSTCVVHELQMDAGPVMNRLIGPFYRRLRGRLIDQGMDQTLANLRRMVTEG